jgi:4-hydroxybenzoate polyprenyltransferase
MFRAELDLKGLAQFISAERGLMLFMISVGATFLTLGSTAWLQAIYLGSTVFFLWSGLDALNNVFDADLDVISDPSRAKYSKALGKNGLLAAVAFSVLSLGLGAITMVPLVVLFILVGILFGVLYSVPPFRLRQTLWKPLVNITVGAVPVLIVASFSNAFSVSVATLVLLIGITTGVNSLWEDLGDYASDYANGARTVPVIAGFKKGLLLTIVMGYCLIPLMVVVGILFQLHLIYYFILFGLTTFVSLRLVKNRTILFREAHASETDTEELYELGHALAKDFVIVAIVQTLGLMISSFLKLY